MVALIRRMRHLQTRLLDIRLGPGAAIFGDNVKRIHLSFAVDSKLGHMGSRKFWRICLPRLKYHNPAIPMTVERSADSSAPATLTIFHTLSSTPSSDALSSAEAADLASAASSANTMLPETTIIDMKHKTDSAILAELLQITNAQVVLPTAEEKLQLQDLQEQKAQSEYDRKVSADFIAAKKQQAAILAQARQSMEAPA